VGQTAEYIPNPQTDRGELFGLAYRTLVFTKKSFANSKTIDFAYDSFRDRKPVKLAIATPFFFAS